MRLHPDQTRMPGRNDLKVVKHIEAKRRSETGPHGVQNERTRSDVCPYWHIHDFIHDEQEVKDVQKEVAADKRSDQDIKGRLLDVF